MTRKTVDCRDIPNEVGCTLAITGEADEVVEAAPGTPSRSTGTRTRRSCATWSAPACATRR